MDPVGHSQPLLVLKDNMPRKLENWFHYLNSNWLTVAIQIVHQKVTKDAMVD